MAMTVCPLCMSPHPRAWWAGAQAGIATKNMNADASPPTAR